jgi:SAM-dependent methyltransferase
MMRGTTAACAICQSSTVAAGNKKSSWSGQEFELRRCPSCGFAFVANPRLDYEALYDDAYYSGRGADPHVNYIDEIDHLDTTIRKFEWRGIWRLVHSIKQVGSTTRWLDYGCGVGSLVEFVRNQGVGEAYGFDQGWSLNQLRERGVPHLRPEALDQQRGTFDVVTAIEVVEHVSDPVNELSRIRALLRPGGLLFLTTGNAAPYLDRLSDWRYVIPDVHISFFTPGALALALDKAGFDAAFPGYQPGWDDIIRFKVLKSLGVRRNKLSTRAVPWPLVSRIVDWRLQLSAQPVGWARG